MAKEKKKPAIRINKLTKEEHGICNEALHASVAQLREVVEDLNELPAEFTHNEVQLLLTSLRLLPPETQAKVQPLIDQLCKADRPVADGGTIIHFPPP